MTLVCWQCGRDLADVLQPLVRSSTCPACEADLYVCRMCRFFAPGVARSCAEPVAEEVRDKVRANFCDYFQARPGAYAAGSEAQKARSQLDALFGVAPGEAAADTTTPDPQAMERKKQQRSDTAEDELRRLFGLDDEKQ
jgi:hypothetical protein